MSNDDKLNDIVSMAIISNENPIIFYENASKSVAKMQEDNLTVEVQYQPVPGGATHRTEYTVLLIGRRK